MDLLWRDVRFAVRSLGREHRITTLAVLALALGIGGTTAIFSIIDNILLDPFPYADSQRMVQFYIHDTTRSDQGGRGGLSVPELHDYLAQNRVFDRAIASTDLDILYTSGEGTERFHGDQTGPGTFEFLGMPALLGRTFGPADYKPDAPPVFVLRYKVWASRFNADPAILNRTFVLNGTPRTLVGIMPPRFGWGDADLWIPASLTPAAPTPGRFEDHYWVLGHLKPGVTLAQAQADLNVVAHRLAKAYPKDYPKQFTVVVVTLIDGVVGQFRVMLFIVMGAVGMLLLIACANVANLLLAQATAREKEIAIRSAIGAGRWRLVRQLLLESLMLGLSGAVFGCLLAWAGLRGLVSIIPQGVIPAEAEIRMNLPVLLFALGAAVVTSLIFGTIPALFATKRDLNDALRDTGKGVSGGFRHAGLRNALIVGEVALSLVLLTGAGLLMRSFVVLQEVSLGFNPSHILVARLPLPEGRYKTAAELTGFYRPLLERLKTLPGVVNVTETSDLPPYGGIRSKLLIPGKTAAEDWQTIFQLCSDGYFPTLGIQLLRGRGFTEPEVNNGRKLAMVNQTFVRRYFPNADPIGQHFALADLKTFPDPVADPTFEIIGVASDVKNQGLQDPVFPEVWVPYTVTGSAARGVLVRTAGDPNQMLNAVSRTVWSVDRGVALTFTDTAEHFISQFSYAQPRFGLYLLGVFAGVGLVLVTIGVYGVIAYAVSRQTHEIGVRMALGADRAAVLRMVLRVGLRLLLIGVAIGLAGSILVGRTLASQLFGISPYDPVTLAGVVALLFVAGLAACLVPARAATRVDPMVALRYE
ncbi:MAG TPA: ABC transporter permease [Bryobacteraceae bacterium]|nr:ABC transporter permease [Bryobacteraceae bacterium]